MPMFQSAYDTTFGRRYKIDSVQSSIVKATVSNYLAKNEDGITVITDTSEVPVDIAAFTHPLYVEKAPYDGLYLDARAFISNDRQSGLARITSVADYNLLLARGKLEQVWREEGGDALMRTVGPLPASVYSAWIAESIGRRFGIEPEDQYKLTIFAAWFFVSMCTDNTEPTDSDFLRNAQTIARATRISAEDVIAVLQGQTYVKDINDFCERLEGVVGNVRLRGFSSILIYPMLSSSWFGANAKEIIAVGIEHIPTFLAVVVSAMTERAYMRSNLSKLIERVPAKSASSDFLAQMNATLKA